jgi:recombinational DNA repair ATPase RecF
MADPAIGITKCYGNWTKQRLDGWSVLTVFAGPNGSGKSSVIRRVDFAGRDHLLEADAIASQIRVGNSGLDPRLILEIRSGSTLWNAAELPSWVRNLLEGVRL